MILGLFLGETLVDLLRSYPKSLLGIMVLAAGIELAKVGESLNHGANDLWEVSELSLDSENRDERVERKQRELSGEERKERWTVMFMTIGGLLAFKNDGVGFLAGMLCHCAFSTEKIWKKWEGWRAKKNERNSRLGRQATTVEEEEELLSGDRTA